MTADPFRCCGCGAPSDDAGVTGCSCATVNLWRRGKHDFALKAGFYDEERANLERRLSRLERNRLANLERIRKAHG
jgi:hypothetical protein